MSHAKEGRKWWQEPKNWAQAMLCTPSCHPWALHEGPWGHEKCNIPRSNLLYIGQAELPYASNHLMHMLILASNFIWQYIKWGPCFGLQKPAMCDLWCAEQPTLSQQIKKIIHPAFSGRLFFVPGKPAAAECWLCRTDISVSQAKGFLMGMGSISIHCNGNVWSWCKGTNWLTEIKCKMVSSSFSSAGKHYRMV